MLPEQERLVFTKDMFTSLQMTHVAVRVLFCQCVNARDDAGQTALHKAAMNGRLECIHLLLDHGVDVNSIDHSGD